MTDIDSPPEFGDYVLIEQQRYGIPNEMFIHKVIGRLRSNGYVDVPVHRSRSTETIHNKSTDVVRCICCGLDETEVRSYRLEDVQKVVKSAA